MRNWWVNQNQTYTAEIDGGYVWSPKRNRGGARNQFYENMRELAPGDRVFSFRQRKIAAIGIVASYCYEAPKPIEFGAAGKTWNDLGWRADILWAELSSPITPQDHIEQIRPLLPDKYAPLQHNGKGMQAVYLAAISQELAGLLDILLRDAGNTLPGSMAASDSSHELQVISEIEDHAESEIDNSELPPTEKEQLVMARRGQGRFRENVQKYEHGCRVSGVSDARFLIASHIKPWRSSTNFERLDGENGLLLSPNIDLLFDRGFISFSAEGNLMISPVVNPTIVEQLGVPISEELCVGTFSVKQLAYLSFHRREIFLKAGMDS